LTLYQGGKPEHLARNIREGIRIISLSRAGRTIVVGFVLLLAKLAPKAIPICSLAFLAILLSLIWVICFCFDRLQRGLGGLGIFELWFL